MGDEPFLSSTEKAIRWEQFRKELTGWLLPAAAVACAAVLSPLLIDGSIWLSTTLDNLFTAVGEFLGTAYAAATAVVLLLPFLIADRR